MNTSVWISLLIVEKFEISFFFDGREYEMIALRVKNLKTEMRENDKTGFLEPRLGAESDGSSRVYLTTEFTFLIKNYGIFPLVERI